MSSLVVFDFDGVLFDSARECLEVAYQTVRAHVDRLPFAAVWRDRPVPPADLAEQFARTRYLVGPPWQYAVLLRCIAQGEVPPTAQFLALAAQEREQLAFFTDAYFAQRAQLAADVRWFSLVRPYAGVAPLFAERLRAGRGVILSTRDERSITALCAHHFGVQLEANHLLPRAGAREKWQMLLDAADRMRLTPGRIFFVDDYLHHALPAYQRGITARLATWGYLGPQDRADAHAAGLPCLELDELASALCTHEETPS